MPKERGSGLVCQSSCLHSEKEKSDTKGAVLGFPPPSSSQWSTFFGLLRSGVVTGKSLDSPGKGNVDEMSETCTISKDCPEGLRTQFLDIFWTIFAYLVAAFCLEALSNARPLQGWGQGEGEEYHYFSLSLLFSPDDGRSLRSDNKINRQSNLHFQLFVVMAFSEKQGFETIFLSAPDAPASVKNAHFIFIVVSPSLR